MAESQFTLKEIDEAGERAITNMFHTLEYDRKLVNAIRNIIHMIKKELIHPTK